MRTPALAEKWAKQRGLRAHELSVHNGIPDLDLNPLCWKPHTSSAFRPPGGVESGGVLSPRNALPLFDFAGLTRRLGSHTSATLEM